MASGEFGEFGGIVKRAIETGGTRYEPGDFVPPAIAMRWPQINRHALANATPAYIAWCPDPASGAAGPVDAGGDEGEGLEATSVSVEARRKGRPLKG